ncbi:MAG TPA: D-aminoacylase [Thermoanaerobaculia bacterium]|nr:D-aminoacylase [Thermoanaerobaculia bacterium]
MIVSMAAFTLAALAGLGADSAPSAAPAYDLLLTNAEIYDGSGSPPTHGSVAVEGDTIVAVGPLPGAHGKREIDLHGLAVSPGFVNVLSWATESLLVDGRAASDVAQGVTLEVFGEGWSMGPLSEAMKTEALAHQGDLKYPITWTTLGQYLDHLEAGGIAVNVASFVGATTVRIHEVGYADRAPTPEELERMKALVGQAMEDGALGLGSSLIYPPAFFAQTPELVALAQVAGQYGGVYISHMRSEGDRLLPAIDELLTIAREARIPAEIYHFKAAGRANWPKFEEAIAKIEAARATGLKITANMYSYTAGATGLSATLPPWAQEGGLEAFLGRLRDPAVRARLAAEMDRPGETWENFFLAAGPEQILLASFKQAALKPLTGKSLAEIARMRGVSPEQAVFDLILEDGNDPGAVYFLMSEDNVRRGLSLPWVSLGSDAEAPAPEGVFLQSSPHPRTYGNFARFLGRYVREERLLPLAEAIRRLTSLPAENLHLGQRGRLAPGYFADLVVFDPARIRDRATYEQPHQLAEGVLDVFVNGIQVLAEGKPTAARPGRAVRRASGPPSRVPTAAAPARP